MYEVLKKISLLFLGSVLILGGAFIAVASISGGLGASTLVHKLAFALGGVIMLGFGLWLYYQGSNKNLLKVIGDIIEALLNS